MPKPYSCSGCSLWSHGTDFSQVEGTGANGILIAGEASGESEARDLLPFRPYAAAGGVLERTFRRLGLQREDFSITNLCRCRPRSNLLNGMSYESSAVQHCRPNLESAYFDPSRSKLRVILALGNIPFSYLTGHGGPGMTVSHLRGYVFNVDASYSSKMAEDADLNNVVVVPTYHPSHIRRGATELFGVFARDVMRAVKIARSEDFSFILGDPLMAVYRDELQYSLHPSRDEARAFYLQCKDSPQLPIVYDLETSESPSLDEDAREQFSDTRVRQIQFSIEHAQAIAMPWKPEYLDIISAILRLPNDKVAHNGRGFDSRVLRAVTERGDGGGGLDFNPAGAQHDTMLMWQRWQPELPANLQYAASFIEYPFAWKHLGSSNLPMYGDCDVDATGRLFRMLVRSMTERGMWQPYLEQVVELHDLPAQVAQAGLHVSEEVAQEVVSDLNSQQQSILAELEMLYPDSERAYEPEEGYKKVPKQVEERRKLWNSERMGILIGERTVEDGEPEMDYIRRITGMVEREFWAKVKNPHTTAMEKQLVVRWCRPKPVSPMSRPQIIRYAKLKKHELPSVKGNDGEARESLTLSDIDLMYGRTKDKFYGWIGKYRRITEEKSLVADLKHDAMVMRGHIHPIFSVAADGGMASRAPNLPKESSQAMRAIIPQPGNVFVRWSWPKQRDHILASLAEVASEFSADVKDIHPAALEGFLVGESDRAILEANRLVFGTSLKTVMQQRERFQLMWPQIARWQDAIRQRAHRQNYLLNRFGEIRWFYEVFAPDGRGGMRNGEQSVGASRFTAETEAAGAMRWRLRGLVKAGLAGGLVAMSRDWLVWEVMAGEVAGHVRGRHKLLEQVPAQLAGVVLPMRVEWGGDMLKWQELQIAQRRPSLMEEDTN